ncbi:MAG TPA: glycoside hydrolase family 18 protein [Ferruginibacter sp.]|nr:glycoside hydrolase family 18 protein [Ferruginibacter sp.]
MTRLKEIVLAVSLTAVLYSCKKEDVPAPGGNTDVIAPPAPFGFYVVGYFPSYRNLATVPDVKFRMCNVINYAFATVSSTGSLSIANPTHLTDVRNKAKANGCRVFISISGAAADFKSMASSPATRTFFTSQAMNLVRTYALDGVDVDWEFPRTDDGTDQTYTLLMKQLSDSCHLGRKYYLTAAITAGKYAGAVRDAISSELWLGNYVDWFNIMSYDDFSTTVPYKHHCDYNLATTSLNYWIGTRGMPGTKAVLGIAGYGRPSGITQTNTVLSYSDILSRGGNPLSDSAVVTNGGFTNYTIYYNGTFTVKRKAMLARQAANGIMLWEKSQDSHDNTSLLKAVCDTIGRTY